jgi:hypothetical protein
VGLWSKRSKLLARKRSEHQVKARQHQRGDRGPGPNLPAQSSPQIKEHVSEFSGCSSYWDLIHTQHHHNNHTTTPHMRVGPSVWGPPSCEGLLCDCCVGVVNLTFSKRKKVNVGI